MNAHKLSKDYDNARASLAALRRTLETLKRCGHTPSGFVFDNVEKAIESEAARVAALRVELNTAKTRSANNVAAHAAASNALARGGRNARLPSLVMTALAAGVSRESLRRVESMAQKEGVCAALRELVALLDASRYSTDAV